MAILIKSGTDELRPNSNLSYSRIVKNRPVSPVQLINNSKRESDVCNCRPSDESPCGKNSSCFNVMLDMECDRSCPVGVKCQNQNLRNRKYAALKIEKTADGRGFGVFSVNDIEPDTFIIEYVGELINQQELDRRMISKMSEQETEFYYLTIQYDLIIDAEFYANKSRFLNHSCSPNCIARKVIVDGHPRIGIYSTKAIKTVSTKD